MLAAGCAPLYDWDSLAWDCEPAFVGFAAANLYLQDSALAPSPEEIEEFVQEFEAARLGRFSSAERRAISAAATYQMAALARLEVEELQRPPNRRRDFLCHGRMTSALRRYGTRYLEY